MDGRGYRILEEWLLVYFCGTHFHLALLIYAYRYRPYGRGLGAAYYSIAFPNQWLLLSAAKAITEGCLPLESYHRVDTYRR